ncbi:MAG: HlyD family efflux transporter periplasmic adaptor subunit [Pseudomonadota bacterium]
MSEATVEMLDDEPHRRRLWSVLIALGPLLTLVMAVSLNGELFFSDPVPEETPSFFSPVAVTMVAGRAHPRSLTLSGTATPERFVSLRAQQSSRVAALPVKAGDTVTAGQVVCRLQPVSGQSAQDLRSPIDGQISAVAGPPGTLVQAGGACVTVIDTSSLILTSTLKPHEAKVVQAGDEADITVGDAHIDGQVRLVYPETDRHGRELRAVEIAAPELRGLSLDETATIDVTTEQIEATIVPQRALVMVSGKGLCVRMVSGKGPTGVVETVPIQLVAVAPGGFYVSGLPPEARLIVRGMGFEQPQEGETVRIGRIN